MSPVQKVIAIGGLSIVTFDLFASIASRQIGFAYTRASFGSYVLYLAIGFFAARVSTDSPILSAAAAGAVGGLVDASIGWAVSWIIGPGGVPSSVQLTLARWLAVAVFVMLSATGIATLGGLAGRRAASVARAA